MFLSAHRKLIYFDIVHCGFHQQHVFHYQCGVHFKLILKKNCKVFISFDLLTCSHSDNIVKEVDIHLENGKETKIAIAIEPRQTILSVCQRIELNLNLFIQFNIV
jgi:hypothetical protein